MRITLFMLLTFIARNSFSQEGEANTLNPYDKFSSGDFEGKFWKRAKKFTSNRDSVHYWAGAIRVQFNSDSTYIIHMSVPYLENAKINEIHSQFRGKYLLDAKNGIVLLGDHPFDSDEIRMKEIKKKEYIYTLGFSFKLNDKLNWITKKKSSVYCDGQCTYERDELPD